MENKPILSPSSHHRHHHQHSSTHQSYQKVNSQQQQQQANNNNEFDGSSSNESSNKSIKKRYVLAIYAFFGFFIAFSLRANLSVAIVDMSNVDLIEQQHSTKQPILTSIFWPSYNMTNRSGDENADTTTTATATTEENVPFKKWSPALQGYILSAFFFGYIITQLPSAFLTTKYGGKAFFGAGIGFCSLLTLFIPLATYLGPTCLIITRVFQGLAQGFIFPAMHRLWSNWAPPFERSRLATFALSGSYLGSVFALSFGGIIGKMFNWQAIFYFFGVVGIIWSILWFYCVYETPTEHETIHQTERDLIESSLVKSDSSQSIPWRQIFTSPAVWAIVSAHFAENWGFYTMLTEMPTFFTEVMGYKIDKAGILSSLPYFTMAVALYVSGNVSDRMLLKKMNYTQVRKIFCCTGLLMQAFFMFFMTFTVDPSLLMILLSLAIGFGGMSWAAFGVNHLDVGAHFANVLISISNTFATIPGIISPSITGHIIEDKTRAKWNVVFNISAAIYAFGGITYFLIGTGELQSWAYSNFNPSYNKERDAVGINNLAMSDDADRQQQQQEQDEASSRGQQQATSIKSLVDQSTSLKYDSINP